ncbi:MAG: ATP-grasp domain-containing protein [Synergistetes bacterium]|nr:ATP-grasp domain-containing protein [Synergistota bacterium]
MLLVGYSVRALVESAISYGIKDVIAIDFFGDWDLQRLTGRVEVVDGRNHLSTVLQRYDGYKVAYSSVLENDVEMLGFLGNRVVGNGKEVVGNVRPGKKWWNLAKELGIRIPGVRTALVGSCGTWLKKPFKSGGGKGISFWTDSELPSGFYLQKFINGKSFSFLFAADSRNSKLFGVTLQLIGERLLGGKRFAWTGNVYPANLDSEVVDEVSDWIERLTREIGLCGVFGVDVVIEAGTNLPYVIEVNPRYTGSMELVEKALNISIFRIHLEACRGSLPSEIPRPMSYFAKGIVYAEKGLCGFNSEEMWRRGFRDIPMEAECITEGSPVCSVFSSGDSIEEVINGLVEQKRWLYEKGVRGCV